SSILIESDVGTVFTACALYGTNNYSLYDISFFHNAAWCCIFNSRNDDIADACISSCRTAKYADAQKLFSTCVVCYSQSAFLLYHAGKPPSKIISLSP